MKSRRNGAIELYRFVFAFMVLMTHGRSLFPKQGYPQLFGKASYGVEFFFLVSGYLMACSAAKHRDDGVPCGRQTLSFVGRKYVSLLPEFGIAMAFNFVFYCLTKNLNTPMAVLRGASKWVWDIIPLSVLSVGKVEFHMGAWYISAMLVSMLLLYPICLKRFDRFTRRWAPAIAAALLGILFCFTRTTLNPSAKIGIFYKGLLRGVAEISLGASLYPVVERLKHASLSRGGAVALSIAAAGMTAAVLWFCTFDTGSGWDPIMVAFMAAIVAILFSHRAAWADIFDNDACMFLGRSSLLLYLSHREYARYVTGIRKTCMRAGILAGHPLRLTAAMLLLYFAGTALIMLLVNLIARQMRRERAVPAGAALLRRRRLIGGMSVIK